MQNNFLKFFFTPKKRILLSILFFCCSINNNAQNLITNGDFGIFNAAITNPAQLGYQSNYTQISYNSGNSVPRQYAISNNPKTVNPTNFKTLFDHTTGNGTGNMMVVDGDGNEIFWKQSGFALIAGTTYTFSYWVNNVNNVANALNPAPKILFNPTDQCGCTATLVSGNGDLALMGSGWQQVVYTFIPTGVAGTTKYVRIELSTINAGGGGNDFAIDDISLTEPLNISSVNSSNVSCPQGNDGVISINVSGGMAPYTYKITGTSTASNNTGVFALGAGTYTVSVTDSKPTTVNYPTPIIITAPADNLSISPSSKTICAGEIVPLVASGGYGNYVWSSDTTAVIAGLSSTSGSNVNATPTATTKYTLTSDNGINGAELITNGGFESGVIAPFTTTGYTLKAGSTGTSSAGQYKISGTSLDLSTDFKWGCVPHSGNKMFMADSPTSANTILEQTVTVVPGVNYQLSYFIQSLGVFSGPTEPSPAVIEVFINGVSINKSTNSNTACSWREIKTIWNSGVATSAIITLKDINFTGTGNDFALDDISFKGIQCTVTKSITLTVSPGTSDTAFTYPTTVCQSATSFTPTKTNSATFTSGGTWSKFSGTGTLILDKDTGVINPSLSTAGVYVIKYEVLANAAICQSAGSSTFSITINSLPTIVSTVPNSRCGSGTVSLSATASTGTAVINWYAISTGGTSLGTGTSFTTPSISSNTTYYVDATENGCTSATRTAVIATVNTIPTIATTTPNSRCGTGTITLNATASAGIVNWYATPTVGISLGTGTSFTTPVISSDTTYYVDASLGTCTTASRIPILATVNTIPVLVISCGTSSGTSVQFNWNTITDATNYSYSYTINGGAPITGSIASGTTTLNITSLSPGQTVAITVTPVGSLCGLPANGNCVSSNCLSPTVNQVSNFPVCVNGIIPAISFVSNPAGATISWACNNTSIGSIAASGTGTIPTFTATNVATQQIATITVTANNGFCTGPAMTFDIIVNPLPSVPTISATVATCLADGSTTISNYNASNTYAFTPSGPTVGSGGLVSGMIIGTSYTVTSNNGSCTSVASTSFTNSAQLTAPAVPTTSTTVATCSLAGITTISNYNTSNTYTFTPSGPTVSVVGLVSGMTIGTSYTVTSNNGSCTSAASASFTNAAKLTTPAVPTTNTTAATCLADGSTTISNYNASNTYTFSPSGPTVGAGGLVSGMTIGKSYTVTSNNGSCTSVASTSFTNSAQLTAPAVPTTSTTVATCSSAGITTISNYNASNTYTFTPSGPTVGAGGLVSGMTIGTSYTVTSNNGSCTSVASASFTNLAQLTTPAVPTTSTIAATCLADGSSTISNYNVSNTYVFTPSGPSVGAGGLVSGMIIGTSYTVTSNNGSCTSVASASFTNSAQLTTPVVPTTSTTAATCSSAGITTISNYNALNTYAFTPSGPSVGAGGLVSGMSIGTSYTVTSNNGSCTSVASASFTNSTQLTTPVVPTTSSTAATCLADGSTTISNYNASNTYTFTPSGPSVGAGGLVSGMTIGTSYTVTSNNGSCTSVASVSFTNAAQLTTPVVPTTSTTAATCSSAGITTISNYNALNTYAFTPSGPTVGAGGLVSGMTIGTSYTVTSNNGSCTSAASVSFTNLAQLVAITPTFTQVGPICQGAPSLNLPTLSNNGINGIWTPSFDNTATTTYTFAPNSGQCAVNGTMTIIVNSSPVVTASPNNQTICTGQVTGIVLTSSIPGATLFNWTVAPIGATGAIAGSGNFISQVLTATGVTLGSVDYSVTPIANGCSGTPSIITVLVSPSPTVIATPSTQSVCSGSAPNIALSSNIAGTVFNWNVVQTNVTGASAGSGNTINQILTTVGNRTGEAVYSVVPSLNGCQGTPILVTITVNPIPVATANPSLATICSGTATSIALTSNVAGATFSWAAIQSGVIGATSGIGNTIAQTLSTAGIVPGSVTYTISPIINGCAGLPITATVTVNPTPEVFGSAGTTICSGESSSILLSPNIPGTQFAWTAVQTNVLGAADGTGDTIDQILEAGSVAGTAVYTVTPSLNGCSGKSIKITINVNPAPAPAIAPGIICVDAAGTTLQTYTLDTNLNTTNYTFKWYWNSALINGAVGSTYDATKEGNYSVIVTNKITGCVSKEVFATIIANNPATSLDAVVSDAFTQEATITASVQGGTGPFLYQIDGGEFQSSNEFTGLSSGTHTLTVKDVQGCTNLSIPVIVIDYPKYFTPNGDGYDDTWNIKGLNDQPNARIFIFDRYGKLIKEISTQGGGWDGTYNGKQLPATDYWFTVEYVENNSNKLFKAHFSLKR